MTEPVASERAPSASCEQPVADLLRAEVAELDGTAATDLSRHVRGCDRCGALARSILAGYEALDGALQATVGVDADRVVAAGRSIADTRVRRRVDWRSWLASPRWAVASAAAAVVVAALWFDLPERMAAPPPVAGGLLASAPARNVAVIQTDNPDITIYWFFAEHEE